MQISLMRCAQKMNIEFGGKNIDMFKSEDTFFEIQAKNCNKGRGVEILKDICTKLHNNLTIYACGDYENDLPMMAVADVSACPLNACDAVKQVADIRLCSSDNGAIADLIERL